MNQDYSTTELAEAERLERYLVDLEEGKLLPPNATTADAGLYRLARSFAVLKTQPRQLEMPMHRTIALRRLALWFSPLPLIAAAVLIYLNLPTSPTDTADETVVGDLALVESADHDLLALQEDLDQSLAEIELLTSTDYIDQL